MGNKTIVQTAPLAIEIEWDPEDRVWTAQVPALNNLSTYGETYQEAVDKCREAILGFFEASKKEKLPLPLTKVETEILLASLIDHPKAL